VKYKEIIHKKFSKLRHTAAQKGGSTTMPWMGKKPGRRKEEGGHYRVDVSLSHRVIKILEVPDNRSKYVEDCVKACTKTAWMAFDEPSVTANDDFQVTKTGATFHWLPNDMQHNAIVKTFCTFQYRCTGTSLRFRMRINEVETPFFEAPGSLAWCPFQFYSDSSFADGIDAECNQNDYVIELQFEPYGSSDWAFVKDIYMFFEVVDGLSALER
jgi:hypothetical protein